MAVLLCRRRRQRRSPHGLLLMLLMLLMLRRRVRLPVRLRILEKVAPLAAAKRMLLGCRLRCRDVRRMHQRVPARPLHVERKLCIGCAAAAAASSVCRPRESARAFGAARWDFSTLGRGEASAILFCAATGLLFACVYISTVWGETRRKQRRKKEDEDCRGGVQDRDQHSQERKRLAFVSGRSLTRERGALITYSLTQINKGGASREIGRIIRIRAATASASGLPSVRSSPHYH